VPRHEDPTQRRVPPFGKRPTRLVCPAILVSSCTSAHLLGTSLRNRSSPLVRRRIPASAFDSSTNEDILDAQTAGMMEGPSFW